MIYLFRDYKTKKIVGGETVRPEFVPRPSYPQPGEKWRSYNRLLNESRVYSCLSWKMVADDVMEICVGENK